MGALAGLLVLGLLVFAFDVISNIFSSKPASKASEPISNRRSGSLTSGGKAEVYSFYSLPQSVKSNYEIKSLQYDRNYRYYDPRPSRISLSPRVNWKLLTARYQSRTYSVDIIVRLTDLSHFRTASAFSLVEQINVDIQTAEAALGGYPAIPPAPSGTIAPPDEPRRLTLDEVLSAAEIESLSASDIDCVSGFLETKNRDRANAYEAALRKFEKAKREATKQLDDARRDWLEAKEAWDISITSDLEQLYILRDEILRDFGVEELARRAINYAPLPQWMPNEFELSFDEESGILILEHRFPHFDDINWVKLVELKRTTTLKPITITERKKAKAEFEPLIALSLARVVAQQLEPGRVKMIAVNGWVEFRSKSTGSVKRAFCASVAAETERLREIDLAFADPIAAFAALRGVTSPSLELAPVAPKVSLNFNDKRFVEGRDILQGLNQNENIAAMDWEDFEHLCRELFEKVFATEGATVSVTQASRDQGVDAVILDPDPIRGGKIVVQAKRYVNTVDVSAVRDLWGAVNHEGAMKGLLVTTSQYGPDAYAFAQGKPITLINGSELLHLLERNGYSFRINLEEARQLLKVAGAPAPKRRGRPPV